MNNLKKLIIVHRHGARYPLKHIYGDLSWPINEHFWENYKGHLTPEGVLQLINIGQDLRLYYNDFITNININKIKVHSNNLQRTKTSAWSFLMGLFPNTGKYFRYLCDHRNKQLNFNIPNHIAIHVEAYAKSDKLFHLDKSKKRSLVTKKNLESSELFNKLLSDHEYIKLCNKMYKMTQLKKLSPSFPIIDRLIKLKIINSQIKIAKAHNLDIIPNITGEEVTEDDMNKIDIVANEIKKCYFIPGNENISNKQNISYCNYLLNEIFKHMQDDKYQFIEFSAHDTTLLALASLLEIKIPIPEFASYFIFEIYKDNKIKIYYNPDPDKFTRKDLLAKRWDKLNIYQNWNNMQEGYFDLNEFGNRYNLYNLQNIYTSILNIEHLNKNGINDELEYTDIQENYPDIVKLFNYIDVNQKGLINYKDILLFFEKLGLSVLYKKFNNIDMVNTINININKFFKIIINNMC